LKGILGLPPSLLLLMIMGGGASCSDPEAGLLDYQDFGGDFTLTDDLGKPYSLRAHDGQVRLLFFGFTHCPDICPTTLNELRQVYETLGDGAQEVQTLFLSVDPERDTPERLHEYLAAFSMPVTGLTGTPQQIAGVAKAYGAHYERVDLDSALGYTMDHSTYLYLLDQKGSVRYLFRYGDTPERIAALVRKLL